MQKKLGAIFLVAGTCIGSGMIALPLVLGQLGLIPSILLMLFMWFFMYFTSLIHLELNLQAGEGLPLGALGKRFSGRIAEAIGVTSLKLLSYSLLSVFIYGGSSVIEELSASHLDVKYSFETIATFYALIAMGVFLLPLKIIDYVNRLFFIGLLAVVALLITGLTLSINWSDLPLYTDQYANPVIWASLIPVVFTSFGFQVIFHTLTNYCRKDVKMLKKTFFWGSLIPAIVYILWTCSVLSAVYHDNAQFYGLMQEGRADVGQLILELSRIAKWQSVQILVWWISILAITTSVIGVGIGLCETLNGMLLNAVPQKMIRHFLASAITIVPGYLVAIYVPNAFIAALGFAGMILAIIAILLPTYLFTQLKTEKLHYPELRRNVLIYLSVGVGVIVILCELFNMYH